LIKDTSGRASNREGGRPSSSVPVALRTDGNRPERHQLTRRQHHRSPGIHRSRSQGSYHRSAHCRSGHCKSVHGDSRPRIGQHDRHERSQPSNVGPLHGPLLHVWRLHDYLDGWPPTHSSPLARNRARPRQRERRVFYEALDPANMVQTKNLLCGLKQHQSPPRVARLRDTLACSTVSASTR
jgi:hypothetical protein